MGILDDASNGISNFFGGFGSGGAANLPGVGDDERKYLQQQGMQNFGRMLMVLGQQMTPAQRSQAMAQMVGNMPDPTQQLGRLQEMKLKQMQMEQLKRQQQGLANFGNLLKTGVQSPSTPAPQPNPQSADDFRAPPPAPLTPPQQVLTSPLPGINGQQYQTLQSIAQTGGEQQALELYQKFVLENQKGGDQPSDVREYNYYVNQEKAAGRQPMSWMEYQTAIKKAGAPSTEITLDRNAGKLGQETAFKLLDENFRAAEPAVRSLENSQRIRNLLDANAITGIAADKRVLIGQGLGMLGITADDPKIADTQQLITELAQRSLNSAALIKGQGSIAQPERELLANAAGGKIELDAKAIRKILEVSDRIAKIELENGKKAADIYRQQPGIAGTALENLYTVRDPNFEPLAPRQPTAGAPQPNKPIVIDLNGNIVQ